MSIIGELRQVPASLIPALQAKREIVDVVMQSRGLSLDKGWDGLRYLLDELCTDSPFGSGTTLRHGDCGYGPPVVLAPAEVATSAEQLAELDEQALRDAFAPEDMEAEGVYAAVWSSGDDDNASREWLVGLFGELRAFFIDAAHRNNGVLFFLT